MKGTLHLGDYIYVEDDNYSYQNIVPAISKEELIALVEENGGKVYFARNNAAYINKCKKNSIKFESIDQLKEQLRISIDDAPRKNVLRDLKTKRITENIQYGLEQRYKPINSLPGCCGASYLDSSFIYSNGTYKEVLYEFYYNYYGINLSYFRTFFSEEDTRLLHEYVSYHMYASLFGIAYYDYNTRLVVATDSTKERKYDELNDAIGGLSPIEVVNSKSGNTLRTFSFDSANAYEFYRDKVQSYDINREIFNHL